MSSCPNSRVIRKLQPGDSGTRALAKRFGTQLLCVRYRESADGKKRFTTVELLITERLVQPRPVKPPAPIRTTVHLQIGPHERELRAKLIQCGAIWNSKTQRWKTTLGIAQALGLSDRIC